MCIILKHDQLIDLFFSLFFDWYLNNLEYDEACEKYFDYFDVIYDKIRYNHGFIL